MAMCSLTRAKILCTEDTWFLVSSFVAVKMCLGDMRLVESTIFRAILSNSRQIFMRTRWRTHILI